MLEKLRNRKKNNKGFSLIELIIVVAILAILTGILAPQYIKWVEKSRVSKDMANAEELLMSTQVAIADEKVTLATGADSTNTATLSASGIVSGNPSLQAALEDIYGAGKLTSAGLVSNEYKEDTYTVTIEENSEGELICTGAWGAEH